MWSTSEASSNASRTRSGPIERLTPARRFFVEGVQQAGGVVEIGGSDAHKMTHVLHLHPGDTIEVIDSGANAFAASIEAIGAGVRVRLVEALAGDASGPRLRTDVAQAVPKGQRMDFVVEKATELGAGAIVPFYSERSVARGVGAAKLERWRRISRTAALQCGRRDAPPILDPVSFTTLVTRFSEYDLVLFPWELAPPVSLRESLLAALHDARHALVVIGPEGGFAHDEAEAAREHGAILLSLGPRILRSETAAMVLLAVIDALAS
jgi:16S rRNA (uracil1498-N3)-methyltransferase